MSEWSFCGNHVNWFYIGIFHESTGWVKYPNQTQFTWSPQMITTNLFMFVCHTIIDLILILMVYVNNFKCLFWWNSNIINRHSNTLQNRFIAMSLCIVLYTYKCHYSLWYHNGVPGKGITHCNVTIGISSNVITHCDVTIGISSNFITHSDVIMSHVTYK